MDAGTIAMIVTAILAVIGILGFLPVILKYAKAVKETLDVVQASLVALSDGKITSDEIAKIKTEIEQAKQAWKGTKSKK